MTTCDLRNGNLDDEFRLLCQGYCVEQLEPTDESVYESVASSDDKDFEPVTDTIRTMVKNMPSHCLLSFSQSLHLKILKYTSYQTLVLEELGRKSKRDRLNKAKKMSAKCHVAKRIRLSKKHNAQMRQMQRDAANAKLCCKCARASRAESSVPNAPLRHV